MRVSRDGVLVKDRVDAALDDIDRQRARVMRAPECSARSVRLAELAEIEAAWWSVLFEHACVRVQWRAALAAGEFARQTARTWRRRAEAQRACEPVAPQTLGAVAA